MSTITKERAQQIFLGNGPEPTASEERELARIALASLEAEAVAWRCDSGSIANRRVVTVSKVVADSWAEKGMDVSTLYTAPPAPVSMPDELAGKSFEYIANKFQVSMSEAQWILVGWNACSAAMLQGAEQQNPQQNIPENIPGGLVEAVNNLLNSDGSRGRYSAIGCGEAREKIELWLAQHQKWESQRSENLCACNSPVIPGGWVACSERMPEDEQEVITHNIFGYRHVSFFDEHSGHFFDRLDGNQIDCVEHVLVSHWMPLPAVPQQEVMPDA
mgnify:CR=1 FL=1